MFRVAVSENLFFDQAGSQFSMLHPHRLVIAAQLSMLDAQCSMLNAQCSMLNAQSSLLNAQSSMLNPRCSLILYTIKVISTKLLKMSV